MSTNMRILAPSRRSPQAGDIFALMMPGEKYLFGRVIDPNAKVLNARVYLIYIYERQMQAKYPIPDLSPTQLLIPPVMINKLPWTKGYFEHLVNVPLGPDDVLKQHCFKYETGRAIEYLDEYSNVLTTPTEPVGQWGIASYRSIDDRISMALKIPLAPD